MSERSTSAVAAEPAERPAAVPVPTVVASRRGPVTALLALGMGGAGLVAIGWTRAGWGAAVPIAVIFLAVLVVGVLGVRTMNRPWVPTPNVLGPPDTPERRLVTAALDDAERFAALPQALRPTALAEIRTGLRRGRTLVWLQVGSVALLLPLAVALLTTGDGTAALNGLLQLALCAINGPAAARMIRSRRRQRAILRAFDPSPLLPPSWPASSPRS